MRGFSLVELSIVIVIIGLLVGGVLVGRDMIDAATTRSLMTDVEKYRTSINVFRDKYLAIPGDMKNATQFWGKDNSLCSGDTGVVDADGTCNGDGNGKIVFGQESWNFWKHLDKAELINSGVTTYVHGSGDDMLIGTNVPSSPLSGASFSTMSAIFSGDTWFYDGNYGNYLRYGVPNPASPTAFNEHSEMKVLRMLSMENKLDDGKPGTGKIRATKPHTTLGGNSRSCTDDPDPAATITAEYRMNMNTESEAVCIALFMLD